MRTCAFCGGDPVKREHVIPEWIAKYLQIDRVTVIATGDSDRRWETRQSFDLVIKAVCEPCNNGWMSNLENAAKPLLIPLFDGIDVVLSAQQQSVIAAWLWKTAVLSVLASRPAYFSKAELRGIVVEPPPDFLRMSVGSFGDRQPIAHADTRFGTAQTKSGDPIDNLFYYLQVRHAIFELVHIRANGFAITRDQRMEQFWPSLGALTLPMPDRLSTADYQALASRSANRPIGFFTPEDDGR